MIRIYIYSFFFQATRPQTLPQTLPNLDASTMSAPSASKKRSHDEETTLLRTFGRLASPDDKEAYSKLRGQAAKKAFRTEWDVRVKNVTATKSLKEKDEKTDFKEGYYRTFTQLKESQGALVDSADATDAATNIANECLRRGAPYVMWNAWSKRLEFMDIKKGFRDSFTQTKERTFSGEMELDPNVVEAALTEAKRNGLSHEIPEEHVEQFRHEMMSIATSPAPSIQTASPAPSTQSSVMEQTPVRPTSSGLRTPLPDVPSTPRPEEQPTTGKDTPIKFEPARPGAIMGFCSRFSMKLGGHNQTQTQLPPTSKVSLGQSETPTQQVETPRGGKNDQDGGKDNDGVGKKTPRKPRTTEELNFAACLVLDKRFETLKAKLQDFVELTQAANTAKDFDWAKTQTEDGVRVLQTYDSLKAIVKKEVSMNNFKRFISNKMYGDETASDFIANLKIKLEAAVKAIEAEVHPLVRMQAAKTLVRSTKEKTKGKNANDTSSDPTIKTETL